jgi:uroporphyrinogen-III decarboxylase
MELEPYVGGIDVERFKATLRGEKVDRVPNFENLVDDQHVTKLLGRFAGNTLSYGGDPAKGASAPAGRPMQARDFLEFNTLIGQDVMIVEALWTPFKKRLPDDSLKPAFDRSVKSRQDWEALVMPGDADIEDRMQYIREYKQTAKGTRMGVTLLGASIIQTLYEAVVGLTDFMMMCYEQRDLVEEMLEVSAAYCEKLVQAAVAEGLDVMYAADDYAWKNGLMIPPKLFKEIWLPRMARIIAPAVSAGIPVLFHSDGKIDETIDWLIDIGVDGINPMDPYGIDYRDYKKRFGHRITLTGNIDVEWPLVHGSPDDVDRDVKEHMDVLKTGGRYIAGSSHSVTNFVPHDNFIAMLNAIHRYGVY